MQIDSIGAPAFIVSVDRNGELSFAAANELFFRQTDLPREWFRGMRVGDVLSGYSRDTIIEQYRRCLTHRAQVEFESPVDRQGYEAVFRTTMTPMVGRDGVIEALLGITVDVTKEKRSEKELFVANFQLMHVLSALQGIAWQFDTRRRSFSGSATMSLLGDIDVNDLAYDDWLKLVHPEDREAYDIAFSRLCSDLPDTQVVEFRVILSGVSRWLRCYRTVMAEVNRATLICGVAIDVTSDVEKREHLAIAASRDSLTGLLNRAAFLQQLQGLINRSERDGQSVTVFMIDLDDFKPVNDARGHAAGDTVLQGIGKRILEGTRDSDVSGRLGGDEFAVAARGLAAPSVLAMANSLRRRIMAPVTYQGHDLSVGVSIGVGIAQSGMDAPALVKVADDALYLDKTGKRGRGAAVPRPVRTPPSS